MVRVHTSVMLSLRLMPRGVAKGSSSEVSAMQQVAAHQQHGLSYDAAIKATAQAELASPHTIRTAMQQFITTGTLTVREWTQLSDARQRGRATSARASELTNGRCMLRAAHTTREERGGPKA